MADDSASKGSSPLFAVFILSLLTLALVPYTIYRLCSGEGTEQVAQPWMGKRKKGIAARLSGLLSRSNLVLLVLWGLWGALLVYSQYATSDVTPFDPFTILQLQPGADSSEVKRAYRKLSLVYHPDKNPDPKAAEYFAEYVTKAYKALTDDVARANYEKYGHPDGQQAQDIGIALPDWIFSKDRHTAPLVLGGLVGIGILLPLAFASCYLLRSNRFQGPNQLMQETFEIFFNAKLGVKEQQGLSRLPDTLVCAMEFITLPTPAVQEAAFGHMRTIVLRLHPELKDKSLFWKRRTSVVKVHMLLLAHMAREPVPDALQKDLKFVLQKAPLLLEEIFKVAQVPRTQAGLGWLEPAKSAVELSQCLTRGVQTSARKASVGKGGTDLVAPMLQLPHIEQGMLKKMSRAGVKTLQDLLALSGSQRCTSLRDAGLDDQQIEDVETTLMALPAVSVRAQCGVEGEDDGDIFEDDLVTCSIRVVLVRRSHASGGAVPSSAKGVQTFAVDYPGPKMEKWYFVLCDPPNNTVWAHTMTPLVEAEAAGAELLSQLSKRQKAGKAEPQANGSATDEQQQLLLDKPTSVLQLWEGSHSSVVETNGRSGKKDKAKRTDGQLVQLRFKAPKAGRHNLQLLVMSDCWIGSDTAMSVSFKTSELSRADREGKAQRSKAAAEDADETADAAAEDDEGQDSEAADDNSEEYDSEETGTEVSASEAEDEEQAEELSPAAKKGQ